MKCNNCEKELNDHALFCNFCGAKVDKFSIDDEKSLIKS